MLNLTNLIVALALVESGGDPSAVNGDCVGILQLRPVFVEECNRLAGGELVWELADRLNSHESQLMALVWAADRVKRHPEWGVRELALAFKKGDRGSLDILTAADRDYVERVEALVRDAQGQKPASQVATAQKGARIQ